MRLRTSHIAAPLALAAVLAAGAAEAASVEVKDAVARVTIIPEMRTGIRVEVIRANPRLPIEVRSLGDRTIVDGGLDRRIRNCRSAGGVASADVRGVGEIGWNDMPQIVIRTPRDVSIDTGGAVFGTIGRSESVVLANSGCGDWTIANVSGAARISQAGSGDTRMGSSGALRVRLAGSGNVSATDVRNGLDVNIAGSGDARVRRAGGPMEIAVAGSGDVTVDDGRVSEMRVTVAGSGDVDFGGSADTLRVRIAGSGDVHAAAVRGEVRKSIMGSGSVRVGP